MGYIWKHVLILMTLIMCVGFIFVWYVYANKETQRISVVIPKEIKLQNDLEIGGRAFNKGSVSILSFGDMMLDRAVRRRMNENGLEYPFESIKDFLKDGNDIVVANAEGPFTHFESKTVGILENGPLEFTFATNTIPVLKKLGFTLLSQANNHSINFGREGLEESGRSINEAGIDWFGDPSNNGDSSYSTTINGIKIAFVGFHEFAGQGFSATLGVVKKHKDAGAFVVVYPHWGNEYEPLFTSSQQEMAHAFINAGADVVIGAHPHVIEPIEIYKNKAIFYSLGNFIFDQSWSKATSEGLAVKITLSNEKVGYTLYPLSILKSQTLLMNEEDKLRIFTTLKESAVPDDVAFESLDRGVFELVR